MPFALLGALGLGYYFMYLKADQKSSTQNLTQGGDAVQADLVRLFRDKPKAYALVLQQMGNSDKKGLIGSATLLFTQGYQALASDLAAKSAALPG